MPLLDDHAVSREHQQEDEHRQRQDDLGETVFVPQECLESLEHRPFTSSRAFSERVALLEGQAGAAENQPENGQDEEPGDDVLSPLVLQIALQGFSVRPFRILYIGVTHLPP